MAEIGAALREARTRARIEIAQMEAQTKIRAKYLRALENEEWELLPGPTYVKSFLKTYGDMLGMDGRQLVTEYKNAHEPFQAEGDIGQMSKHTGGRINRQQSNPPLLRRLLLGLVLIVVVAGGAYVLVGRGDDAGTGSDTPAVTTTDDSGGAADEPDTTAAVSSVVVTATDDVTVCVRAGRRIAVPVRELRAGQKTTAVRGRNVVVTVTNRDVQLRVNGQREALPSGTGTITVSVTADGVKRASASATACRV